MNCEELVRWIGPLVDGELDAKNTVEVRGHLDECPGCKRRYEVEAAMSGHLREGGLGYEAPMSLQKRIFANAAPVTSQRSPAEPVERGSSRWLLLAGWPVAAAACAILATVLLQARSAEADDIVSAHVRSLLVDHLNDVVSTDRHTVKPWFAGKIDFAPPVPDLSALGFELVGGRLDYVQDQPVAAVVYRKHGHVINVLISLPGHTGTGLPHSSRVKGYALRAWRQAGLDLVAVSDIEPLELEKLEKGYRTPAGPASEPLGRG